MEAGRIIATFVTLPHPPRIFFRTLFI
ncbi:hypothetical protein EDF81_3745 [Enterobacter sp. BIGb0383]|nr:hypothetical protein EDF81_3745 [Enterobacter sp. BIGb0383]ROS05932.1 hypothetical protein EC848_3884 [Enterobacter sp. BIGb0359]